MSEDTAKQENTVDTKQQSAETAAPVADTPKEEAKKEATAPTAAPATAEKKADDRPRRTTQKRNFRSKAPRRRERVKPEYEQKIISLRRVTRVMAGGRRFSFSAALVIGDRKGRVGVGLGKASDTSLAIQKAFNDAKRNLVKLQLTDEFSIPFETDAKFNSATINLRPNGGRGLVAGSAARTILDFAGVRNVTAKALSRTRNKINIARATMLALDPFVVARGAAAAPAKKAAEKTDMKKDAPKGAPKKA